MTTGFQQAVHRHLEELKTRSQEFPWSDKRFYALWLAQTYYFVCHSTRLLSLAAARFSIQHDELHQRFLTHANEEKRHEKLALRDIEKLGFALSELPEFHETEAFYQTQYYWIDRVSPIAFFGYILALEGLAVWAGQDIYKQVASSHGVNMGSFLKVHAGDDPEHLTQAIEQIDRLGDAEKKLILHCLSQSCALYEALVARVFAESKSIQRKAA